MISTVDYSAQYILEGINDPNSDNFDKCLKKVKSLFELTEPVFYDYRESQYSYTDYYMANIKFKKKVEVNSADWYIGKEILDNLEEYPFAKYIILYNLIDIKNAILNEYVTDFRLVRYAVVQGEY